MKLLSDLEGIILVVRLNKDIIERSIKLKYHAPELKDDEIRPVKGADYVNKIIQVPFGLAQISMEQQQTYFDNLVTSNTLLEYLQQDLRNAVRPHLNYLSEGGSVNPREVKRFINSYTLQLMMLKPKLSGELNGNVILALQVMNFRPDWLKLYNSLAIDPALFEQAVSNAVSTPVDSVINIHGSTVPLPSEFVTYVDEPFGHSLLTANIDAYLSSAESTRSSAPGLLTAQAEVAKIRGLALQVGKGDSPSPSPNA